MRDSKRAEFRVSLVPQSKKTLILSFEERRGNLENTPMQNSLASRVNMLMTDLSQWTALPQYWSLKKPQKQMIDFLKATSETTGDTVQTAVRLENGPFAWLAAVKFEHYLSSSLKPPFAENNT
jgi:hypothetical protein